MRTATFKTVVGDIKFGPNGELSKPFVVTIQFHDLKNGDLQPFRDLSAQTILWPKEYKTGEISYPYADAKK
jgi:branched-chain amino acid transport system substrate-binding protein